MDNQTRPARRATITLPIQGDLRAENATEPHFMALRTLLRVHCRGPYSPEVDEFCLVLRIDGELCHWDKEGCAGLRRNKKGRYMIIDIHVPRARWKGLRGIVLRRYLATCVEDALRRMIGKLQRDRTPVDGLGMMRDLAVVKERFLPRLAGDCAALT